MVTVSKRAIGGGGLLRMLACAWLLGLNACGGGGGDSGAAPGPAVTVGAPSVTSVKADVLAGDALNDVVLAGTVSGDLASLNGRTVFVIVEDPAALFQPTAQLQLQQNGAAWNYTLTLHGQPLTAAGRRTGKLRVFVCLDAACATQLGGTPLSIPFDVNVIAGLLLSTNAINLSVPFGTVPVDQLVNVTLSSFSTTWVPSDATPFNPSVTNPLTVVNANQPNAGQQLTLRLGPAAPGAYTLRVGVHTTATTGGNVQRDFDEFIDIHYTVTPSTAVDHLFSPPTLQLMQSASDQLVHEAPYQLITNTGTTSMWLGITFDPVTPQVGQWWDDNRKTYHSCVATNIVNGVPTDFVCLTPGIYTARVSYRLDGPLGQNDVDFVITLTVTP